MRWITGETRAFSWAGLRIGPEHGQAYTVVRHGTELIYDGIRNPIFAAGVGVLPEPEES